MSSAAPMPTEEPGVVKPVPGKAGLGSRPGTEMSLETPVPSSKPASFRGSPVPREKKVSMESVLTNPSSL